MEENKMYVSGPRQGKSWTGIPHEHNLRNSNTIIISMKNIKKAVYKDGKLKVLKKK